MFLRMKCENFVLAAEIPCEWKFATKFASECECDGLVHSARRHIRQNIGGNSKRSQISRFVVLLILADFRLSLGTAARQRPRFSQKTAGNHRKCVYSSADGKSGRSDVNFLGI